MSRKRLGAEKTKQQIADAARSIFSQKGYTAASMDEICALSKASKGSLYYHFKSKEELFFYVLEMKTTEWIEKWRELSTGVVSVRARMFLLSNHYAMDFENPLNKAAEEFSISGNIGPELMEKLLGIIRRHYPLLRELLQEGMANGEFTPREDLDDVIYILNALLSGLALAYFEVTQEKLISLHRKAIELFLNGISLNKPV